MEPLRFMDTSAVLASALASMAWVTSASTKSSKAPRTSTRPLMPWLTDTSVAAAVTAWVKVSCPS